MGNEQSTAQWAQCTVADVAELLRGVSYAKEQSSKNPKPGLKPILRANNINQRLSFDDLVFVPESLINAEQMIKKGDIIFAMSSGSINLVGKSARADFDFDGSYGAFCARLRPAPQVSNKYLYYLFQDTKFRSAVGKFAKGSNINNLKREHIIGYKLSIAPVSEQHRIVAKLEELFSELDKGVETLRTAQQQLKVYRQTLLKHAFEGKLTADATQTPAEAPWPKRKLGDLLDFLTSGSRGWAAYYADAGDIFIRAQNIKHDHLDLSDIAFVDLPGKTEGLRTRVQKGDLLITITGANVTKAALVEHAIGTAYVSQHVALCRPSDEVLPKFLYWYIVAEAAGRKQLTDLAYGAGKPGLNLENIRSINVHLPDLVEQARVVELIENKLSVVEDFEKTITHSLQQAEALRQSILKKAFSGQLVPQDSNDEPASVLLERIRAERAAQPKARGRKAKASA